MLSEKIDLTENRDFGNGANISGLLFDSLMLTEIYHYKHSSAFILGKKGYENEYYIKIKTDIPDERGTSNQCQCCGKILAPWNLTYGLCKECYNRISREFPNYEDARTNMVKKCPWTKYDYPNEKDILLMT